MVEEESKQGKELLNIYSIYWGGLSSINTVTASLAKAADYLRIAYLA